MKVPSAAVDAAGRALAAHPAVHGALASVDAMLIGHAVKRPGRAAL